MTVGPGNAAVRRGLVIACEFAFFHTVYADEADDSLGIFENQAGTDLIRDSSHQAAIRLGNNAPGRLGNVRSLSRLGSIRNRRFPAPYHVSGDQQQRTT